jgi:hypothetical protein
MCVCFKHLLASSNKHWRPRLMASSCLFEGNYRSSPYIDLVSLLV